MAVREDECEIPPSDHYVEGSTGEVEGYGPYKPIPPPKPAQQEVNEGGPTPPPYRMPPLPVVQQQFQQQHPGPTLENQGSADVELLPGAPEASPPLHTHSSKFPIEREVIVSSAEKASDTFKAKIPLIQDYGKRLVGGVGVTGVGSGVSRGIGSSGLAAVAPDAPIKQVAWTESGVGKGGKKVAPSHQHHHHHVMSPSNMHPHGSIYGQQFQSQDGGGIPNRQQRDSGPPHHYNGQLTGAIPRRDWGNTPSKEDGGPSHRNQGGIGIQSLQHGPRNDPGITWSTPNAMHTGSYSNAQGNSGTPNFDSAQEEHNGECGVNPNARQLDERDANASQASMEQYQSRTDFDVEANSEGDKATGRTSNQSSSKPFPSRTYHHIKDMISSRFGNKARDGSIPIGGGDLESASVMKGKESKEGMGSRQGLNNSGCRSVPNISEACSPRMPSVQQPSNRKSNNLGEREDVHQRMEMNHGHYQQAQLRKSENENRGESVMGQGGKDHSVDQHGGRREQQVFQRGMGALSECDYGQGGLRRNGRREDFGSRELIEKDMGSAQKGPGGVVQQSRAMQEKRKEDEEDSTIVRGSTQHEFSIGSMGIGEPAYYSTPVGEQGNKQNNTKYSGLYGTSGGDADGSAMMQHMRLQGQGNTPQAGHSSSTHSLQQGCYVGPNRASVPKGMAKESERGNEDEYVRRAHGVGGRAEGGEMSIAAGRSGLDMSKDETGCRAELGGPGCFIYQDTSSVAIEVGSAGDSMGGGSSDYEKATHRSGRSTSTDSGRGTAGHGMIVGRKGASRDSNGNEKKRDRGLEGQSSEKLDRAGLDHSTESNFNRSGSHPGLHGHSRQNSGHDSEWVDVVECELQQILDPKHPTAGDGFGMSPGVAHSVVSESMSMTPPLPPLSPGGSPPSSPLCARKDRGKHYKLSSSMPYINKPGQSPQKQQVGSHSHLQQGPSGVGFHQTPNQGKGGSSSRLYPAISHPGGIQMMSKGGQPHGRQQGKSSGMGGRISQGPEGGSSTHGGGSRSGVWVGSGRASKGAMAAFGDRARAAMRKDQQFHGMGANGLKAMLSNSVPLASFGAPPGFDNGDMTSTTTGLDLDSMLDGPTENTSEEDMSATIDTTDAHAIRKQLEGLENMYSEVLKLLGVKKHGSRYQPSDPRINKRRMYGSLSSLPSSASSRPVRDKRRQDDRKKVKDIKGINKRFQRLESHVVTLARSVAHLSSEMRTQHLMMQEIETIRGEIAQLRAQPLRSPSVPWLTTKAPIEKDSFCNNVPALTNPERVKKLTKFFGDEPPLLRIFLKKLGYEKYATAFEHERIGLVELPYLTEERLQKMGIPMGPRLRILQEAQISFCNENMSVYVV